MAAVRWVFSKPLISTVGGSPGFAETSFTAGGSGLGTQIVQALVSGEMRGRITWQEAPEGGTEVIVEVTLQVPSIDNAESIA